MSAKNIFSPLFWLVLIRKRWATCTIYLAIRMLVIDGFSNHDWKQTTALIRGIIEPTGLFTVSVSTAPPTANSSGWDAWRPEFSRYDVVIQNSNDIFGGPSWPQVVQKDFEK